MTGKTVEEAVEAALDRLGVAETDAEVVVVEEPKSGVFGLRRSNARIRARVRPVQPRAKRPSRRGTGASGGGDRGARRQSGRSEGRKAADEAERDGSRVVLRAVAQELTAVSVSRGDPTRTALRSPVAMTPRKSRLARTPEMVAAARQDRGRDRARVVGAVGEGRRPVQTGLPTKRPAGLVVSLDHQRRGR